MTHRVVPGDVEDRRPAGGEHMRNGGEHAVLHVLYAAGSG